MHEREHDLTGNLVVFSFDIWYVILIAWLLLMTDQRSHARPGSSSGGGTIKERIGVSVAGLCTFTHLCFDRMLQLFAP